MIKFILQALFAKRINEVIRRHDVFVKTFNTLASCKTREQFKVAVNYLVKANKAVGFNPKQLESLDSLLNKGYARFVTGESQ